MFVKYYLATDNNNNNKQVRSLVKKLKTKGYYCVNEWNVVDQSNERELELHIVKSEESMIEDADFILVFLTAGKGNLYNIGLALALNKKMIVYSPEKDHYHIGKKSIFYSLPNVCICSGTIYKLDKAIRLLNTEHQEKETFQFRNEKVINK